MTWFIRYQINKAMFPSDKGCDMNTIQGECFHFWKVEQGEGCWCSWMFMPLTCLCYPFLPASIIQSLVIPMDWVSGLCPSIVLSYLLSFLSFQFRPHYFLSKPLHRSPPSSSTSGLLRLPTALQHASRWIFSMSCYTAPSLNPFRGFLLFITFQVPKPSRCGLNCLVRLLLD